MTRQSLRRRIERLEKLNGMKDKPIIVIKQSLDDPGLYYLNDKPDELLTEKDMIEKYESDHTIILVSYVKDWRGDQNV